MEHFPLSDPVKFWSLMNELGILDDILEMISSSVEQTRRLINVNPSQRDLGILFAIFMCYVFLFRADATDCY